MPVVWKPKFPNNAERPLTSRRGLWYHGLAMFPVSEALIHSGNSGNLRRRRFRLFPLLLVWAALCSCGAKQSGGGDDSLVLGFSQIGAESAWRNCNTRSVQEAAARAGIQLLFFNAEQKQENQIKAIRSFIAYQVDVIAFVPIVSSGWENVLEEARDAGIPVLSATGKSAWGIKASMPVTWAPIRRRRAATPRGFWLKNSATPPAVKPRPCRRETAGPSGLWNCGEPKALRRRSNGRRAFGKSSKSIRSLRSSTALPGIFSGPRGTNLCARSLTN